MTDYQWTQEDRTPELDDLAATIAADKAFMEAYNMADKMYAALYPELDDKRHAVLSKGEMIEWLVNGGTATSLKQTLEDWNDYNHAQDDDNE